MKKNLLTMLLGLSFLFVSATFVRAETTISQESSVSVSKKFSAAMTVSKKINAMKKNCKADVQCMFLLMDLIVANDLWVNGCDNGNNHPLCGQFESLLLARAASWEAAGCANAKNIDATKDDIRTGNMSLHSDEKKQIRKEFVHDV
jgi:hypothetical protein